LFVRWKQTHVKQAGFNIFERGPFMNETCVKHGR